MLNLRLVRLEWAKFYSFRLDVRNPRFLIFSAVCDCLRSSRKPCAARPSALRIVLWYLGLAQKIAVCDMMNDKSVGEASRKLG